MRLFMVIDSQHVILAVFLGVIGAIIIYLSFWYGTERDPVDEVDPTKPQTTETEKKSIPPVLVFLYAGIIVYMVLYVIFFFGVFGGKSF